MSHQTKKRKHQFLNRNPTLNTQYEKFINHPSIPKEKSSLLYKKKNFIHGNKWQQKIEKMNHHYRIKYRK